MTTTGMRGLRRTAGAVIAAVLLLPAGAAAEETPDAASEAASDAASEAVVPVEDDTHEAESAPQPDPDPAPAPDPDPVGGWAVIDPVTGDVKNVIVCTESVCGESGEWGGVLPGDTSCAGCLLRKQTNGTADGNVAGWRSSDGMAVTYDGDDTGTFTIHHGGPTGSGDAVEQRMVLDPARTATDPDGMDLHTGIVERTTTGRFAEDGQNARATVEERRPEDDDELRSDRVVIEFDEWERDFSYGSAEEAAATLEADADAALREDLPDSEGAHASPDAEVGPEDDGSEGTTADPQENPVVRAIQTITRRIVTFLSSWFGG